MRQAILILLLLSCTLANAQTTIDQVRQALNAGSAKELVKYFNEITDLTINDKGANYSRVQAIAILRDFFQKNAPLSFDYIHKGASPEGLRYNIGMYTTKSGIYRVVLLLKEVKGKYVIDTMSINLD